MTIGNLLKKPVLASLAVLAVYNVGHAEAFNPRTQSGQKPSIEINLDVLDKLAGNPPVASVSDAAPEKGPFGDATAPSKSTKSSDKKAAHKKSAHKKTTKPKPKKIETVPEVKAVHPAPDEPSSVVVPLPGTPSPHTDKPQLQEIHPLPLTTAPAPSQAIPALPPVVTPAPAKAPEALQLQPLPLPAEPAPVAPPAAPSVNASAPVPLAMPVTPAAPSAPVKELTPIAPLPDAIPAPPVPGAPASVPSAVIPTVPVPAAPAAPSAAAPAPEMVAIPPLPATPSSVAAKAATNNSAPDLQIVFSANETDVPLNETSKLDDIAMKLIKNPDLRASIIAYASGSDAVSIYPKRVSLARGIAVRDYLTTARNIDVERVTVKALGNKSEAGPADRVDLFLIK